MATVRDSETLTIGVAASGLTAAKIETDVVRVTVASEVNIRFWTSAKNPTATDGIPLYEGTYLQLSRQEALSFRAIRNGGVDVRIHVQYMTAL
jgi:hypothetical protein